MDIHDYLFLVTCLTTIKCILCLPCQVGVYPKATKTSHGLLDMSKHDLGVTATVGQVKIVVLFLFINRLLSYLKQFNVSEDTIESARKSAQEGASAAVTAVSVKK